MQTVIGLVPLVAFFVAYKLGGIYLATAALMVVMVLVLGVDWLRERRIPPVHALSAVLVLIFGTATLVLHNSVFIQWKPTVLFWIIAAAFLGSFWIGRQTLTERFLGTALEDKLTVPPRVWRALNLASVLFYAGAGALNLAVARLASEATWVNFKLFGLTVLTFAFTAAQVFWLASRGTPVDAPAAPPAP